MQLCSSLNILWAHWVMSEDTVCHNSRGWCDPATSGQRPEMLSNILQCPGQFSKTKNYPAQNSEKFWKGWQILLQRMPKSLIEYVDPAPYENIPKENKYKSWGAPYIFTLTHSFNQLSIQQTFPEHLLCAKYHYQATRNTEVNKTGFLPSLKLLLRHKTT